MTSESDYRLNRRLRRFVAAVEGLDAGKWGEVQAAAARMSSKDLAGFLDRSSYLGVAFSGLSGAGELLTVPAAAALQLGGWAVGNFADGVRVVLNRPSPAPLASSVAEELAKMAARRESRAGELFPDAMERLSRCAVDSLGSADAPRAADPSFLLLVGAALAIAFEHRLGAERAARLYAPMERIIPWSSLVDTEPEAPSSLPGVADDPPY